MRNMAGQLRRRLGELSARGRLAQEPGRTDNKLDE